jgi:hypothetical protein
MSETENMTAHQKEVKNKILVVGDETVDKISLLNGVLHLTVFFNQIFEFF